MCRQDAEERAAAGNKRSRLHRSKTVFERQNSIRRKFGVAQHVPDYDRRMRSDRTPARGPAIRGHAAESPQKRVIEAMLRGNRKRPRSPVHELNVAKRGTSQLQAAAQRGLEDERTVGAALQVLSELIRHVLAP